MPYSDILVAELFLEVDNWHNGNGYAIIGYHNKTTLAVSEQPAESRTNNTTIIQGRVGSGWI